MRHLVAALLAFIPGAAFACDAPVCLVNPDSLVLPKIITFDDQRSGAGPGHHLDDILPLPGATFGERFAGQSIQSNGPHDAIAGDAFAPLTMMPGAEGQNLSLVHFSGNTVLNGYGAAGFPRRDGQGEGAIAVLFDNDQSALSIDLRGGEAGAAFVRFHRRDGTVIGVVPVEPVGEFELGFYRNGGAADIAGFVITNSDPQGIAIDTIRFGKVPDVS